MKEPGIEMRMTHPNLRRPSLLLAAAVLSCLSTGCMVGPKYHPPVTETPPAYKESPANTYTADQAKSHVGERATVCGVVASTHFSAWGKGQPTFLNLDKPYPNQVFTILIWGSDRPKFGNPERDYARKNVCVTGTIQEFRGTAEIIARSPAQITLK